MSRSTSSVLSPSQRRALAATRPRTPDDLHFWVEQVLGLDVPRQPRCTELGHQAPFDYLQAAYFDAFADAVVWANRGGGKTLLGAVVTLLDALFKPGVAVRILGGSLEQSHKMYGYLRRLLLPQFSDKLTSRRGMEAARPVGRSARFAPHIGARSVRFANGSEVEILAQSERSVRGNRVQKMRCDEVELFDTEVWTSCQLVTESRAEDAADEPGGPGGPGEPAGPSARDGRHRPSGPAGLIRGAVEAFSTMHRPHGLMQQIIEDARSRGSPVFRWCVLDVLERCPDGRDCAACPLAGDCAGRAKHGAGFFRIDDALAARARVSRETWESEMLCLRPSRRGAVFADFTVARHVGPVRYQPAWPLFRAIDFGFVNPFVCLWIQLSPAGDVTVLAEYVRARATLAEHIRQIRLLDPGPVRMSYCDPAGGQADQITGTTARAELRAAGIATRARPSAITDGLELVRRHLQGQPGASPTLRIDASCRRLIAAMEAYHYAEAGSARAGGADRLELPVKDGVHDHAIDALRYFFVNHLAGPTGRVVERMY